MSGQLLYPTTVNAVSKQLNANYTNADAVITLTNTTSIQNKPGVCLINRIDVNGTLQSVASWTYIEFTATSGATLTGCTVISGGQDQALGKVVEFISDVTQQQRILDALALLVDVTDISVSKAVLTTGSQSVAGTKTFASIKVDDDGIDYEQIATPANPSAGRNKAYFKSDDKLYKLTSAGVESEVGASTVVEDGWTAAGETWTYASADDPTFTFTIAGVDKTTKYSAGMRIKLTQTTAKYFIITKVAFSTDTTITVYGGTDYDLANAAITSPYYSIAKAPALFPLDPTKWTVSLADSTDRSQASPTSLTWYNLGSLSLSIPIGVWDVDYSITPHLDKTGVNAIFCTLSTANNSESDSGFTTNSQPAGAFGGGSMGKRKTLALTAKTSYYVNLMTSATGATTLYSRNSSANGANLAVLARCSYL